MKKFRLRVMGGTEIVARGREDAGASVVYSAGGYAGVCIDPDGLLTISEDAAPGTVTV